MVAGERTMNAVRSARHYAEHRERKLAWMREYYLRNRERILLQLRQRRHAADRRARAEEVVDVSEIMLRAPVASPEDKVAGGESGEPRW